MKMLFEMWALVQERNAWSRLYFKKNSVGYFERTFVNIKHYLYIRVGLWSKSAQIVKTLLERSAGRYDAADGEGFNQCEPCLHLLLRDGERTHTQLSYCTIETQV